MQFQLTTPVAFFIFNRPDVTLKVFERIRDAKPQKLFIIADGARFMEEEDKCNKARSIIGSSGFEGISRTNGNRKPVWAMITA